MVGAAGAHAEHAPVLKPSLLCAHRLLLALVSPSGELGPDAPRLFQWMLEHVQHSNPKVRHRAHQLCVEAIGAAAPLSGAVVRFVEGRLGAPLLKDVQPALFLLHFLKQA